MPRSSILIVTGANDLHGRSVERELQKAHVPVLLLPSDEVHNFGLSYGGDEAAIFNIGDDVVNLDDVAIIWWRRPLLTQRVPIGALTDDQFDYVNRNAKQVLRSALESSFKGLWISKPYATDRCSDKTYQLAKARQAGLRVPDTLVSNNPTTVREFYDRHNGEVIIKAPCNSGRQFLATRQFDIARVTDEQISVTPSIYQELIVGTRHLRVNCFGSQVHTAMIETPDLDWRSDISTPVHKWDLGQQLEEQLLHLLDDLDLTMGIMDLKVAPDGEAVWFEVNPQGQFLFLDPLTGQDLLGAFTSFLMDSRSSS